MKKELLMAKNELSSLSKRQKIETIRYKLLSICSIVLLSTDLFKLNKDIEPLLLSASIVFRPYVYRSRTLIIAKIIRYIENATDEQIFHLVDVLKDYLFETKSISSPNKKNKDDNDIDSLLEQFGRTKS
ncbi:hypothetical protein [Enterococcus sp. 2201sp1_2201st1_B8_2201SCRN_220225]|uniref:hypothetical protein n=1 Tax=unclassified Enterococcus TaxID=2608891 RepID=UPI0034A47DCE